MVTFGEQVKILRKQKHITQKQLAEKIGVDFTYISKMEKNKTVHSPSEKIIRKIALVLETNAEDLILLAGKLPRNWLERLFQDKNKLEAVKNLLRNEVDSIERKI